MKKVIFKRVMTHKESSELKKSFVSEKHYDTLITESCDGYSEEGELLFKFRKKALPLEVLKKGYDSFKGSIELTEGRGAASGSSHKRIRKDGSVSNITVGNKVRSGNVGYMDPSAMVRYCRKTAFAQKYFETFKEGIPFINFISEKYKELCPDEYSRQKAAADNTDENYIIGDSVFSTVTVNENFRTAIHKDAGDFKEGFGNLIVYREGSYDGGFFCLPEFGLALDLHNGDVLFVDVHKWHGNSEVTNKSEDWKRVSFVIYLREKIQSCSSPSEELGKVRNKFNGKDMTEKWV